MAEKMLVVITLKGPLAENQLDQLKSGFKKYLKADVTREKMKGKNVELTVKASSPALLTEDGIKNVFKKCKLGKEFKKASIER